ncbi:MAG: hypothetical protein ACYC2K_05745 [Gemmatimonadales bacterium]
MRVWVRRSLVAATALVLAAIGLELRLRSLTPRGEPAPLDALSGPSPLQAIKVPRLRTVTATDDALYAIEDHSLYHSRDGGASFQLLGTLPKPDGGLAAQLRNAVARLQIVRRIRLNRGPGTVVRLSSGTLLVFFDRDYRTTNQGQSDEVLGPFPGGFPTGGVAVGAGDTVLYGEYRTDPRPHPVRLVRGTEDGRHWETINQFASGVTFHVHSVTWDPYRQTYWIATGDRGDEIMLLAADGGLRRVDTLLRGTQDARIVSMIVTDSALYWGSDNDEAAASIFRFDPASRVLTKLQDIGNPSYASARLADGTLIVTTTFEPGSRFTQASGAAMGYSSLWASRTGQQWTEILRLPADTAAALAGRRAQIQLPATQAPLSQLVMTPFWTIQHDFSTLTAALPPLP